MTTMQYCSNNWNPGCCSSHNINAVTFDNLKTKYSMNEDIRIEYTLHRHMRQASTRDWIGIFPRGWTNLQQYLTFEYALVAPQTTSSPNRSIVFPRVFHQQASSNIEYQLVYVSREIQVLATSPYFRLIQGDDATRVLRVPYGGERNSDGEKSRQIYADSLSAFGSAPPRIVLSDQSLSMLRPPGIFVPKNSRLTRSCRSCGKPRDNGCQVAASRARSLATQNASLAERVIRLERDLALVDNVRSTITSRLRAYEKFVAEMLTSLAEKRAVKITDGSGKEMVLQQVLEVGLNGGKNLDKESPSQRLNNPPDDPKKISAKDRVSDGENPSTERIPSSEGNLRGDEEAEKRSDRECTINLDKKIAVGIDIATQTFPECLSRDESPPSVEEAPPCEEILNKETRISEECKKEEEEEEEEEAKAEGIKIPDSNEVAKVRRKEAALFNGGGGTDEENKKLMEEEKYLQRKPSAIVIEGSNVKFAIIRY